MSSLLTSPKLDPFDARILTALRDVRSRELRCVTPQEDPNEPPRPDEPSPSLPFVPTPPLPERPQVPEQPDPGRYPIHPEIPQQPIHEPVWEPSQTPTTGDDDPGVGAV